MRSGLTLLAFLLLLSMKPLSSQMNINGQLLYGNEWYELSQDYLVIKLDTDGIYKITYEDLVNAGVPVQQVTASSFQLFYFGEEVAIHTTSEGSWQPGDYFLFYGKRNDGELDKQHFGDWENEQLNPFYSLYTDESAYYLSWSSAGPHKRYELLENNLSGNLPPRTGFYYHNERQVFSDFAYAPSSPLDPNVENSKFIASEGFGNRLSQEHNLDFQLSEIYSQTSLKAKFRLRTGANIQYLHVINIYFNGDLKVKDTYNMNAVRQYEVEIPLSDLKNNSTIKMVGKGIDDNTIVSYAEIVYPRYTTADNADQFVMELNSQASEKYFEIEDFNGGGTNWLFDIQNDKLLVPVYSNNKARFRYPGNLTNGKLWLINGDDAIRSPLGMELYQFTDFDDINPEYLILTSERLNNSDSLNGINPIEEYANYRSTASNNDFETAIINVEDLFHHFSYGINGHSQAIRNFSSYIQDKWPQFRMVFIVGKGLSYLNRNKPTPIRSFVPTFGKPGSDNLLFAQDTFSFPFVAVGRLAAHNGEDVLNYLEKVQLHDEVFNVTNEPIHERMWRKNILHLSGGDPSIQDRIFDTLQRMQTIIEHNKFGGNVTTFQKTSTDPVQTSLTSSIIKLVNEGVSVMTFFGHSSAGTFDFSIEDPEKYDNTGRYPIINSMGCHSGDIHEAIFSLSEDFILTPGKGAIAFVAASGNSFVAQLGDYGIELYNLLGQEYYGKPIGFAIREILEKQKNPLNIRYESLHQQTTLHGDPAIRLYAAEGPDYVVDFSSISTTDNIGTLDGSFELSFDIINLGMGQTDSLSNYLVHSFSDNKRDTIYFDTEAPYNRTHVSLEIPNPGKKALGQNCINIFLDYKNEVDEWPTPDGENNNELKRAYNNNGYCFYIFDNSAFPVYPKDFSIVNNQDLFLCASSSNAFGSIEQFLMELDTTEEFNSPLLRKTEITSRPSLIKWNPDIQFENGQVYYWRISPKSGLGQVKWNTSSFIFLENESTGWNQSHLYQWQKDEFHNYEYNAERRAFLFAEDLKEIRVKNGTFRMVRPSISYQTDKSEYIEYDSHIEGGVLISSFDGLTGVPYTNEIPALHGSYFSSPWAINYMNFPFRTDTKEERAKAINFIENVVPNGDYIVIYTIQRSDINVDYEPEEWASDGLNGDPDLMSVLEKYGAERVRELENGARPYIFVFRKNRSGFTPIEVIAASPQDAIEAEFKILGRWHEGDVRSTRIGPSEGWNRLFWEVGNYNPAQDTFQLDLIGVKIDGTEDLLMEDIKDYDLDISHIDHNAYPFLRLYFYAKDELRRNSTQLKYWRVTYRGKPELAYDTGEEFIFKSDTLYLGQQLELKAKAVNICQTDMDSVLIRYTIIDKNNNPIEIYDRLPPLKAQESTDINFSYTTDEKLLGKNEFRVELNPDMDQEEEFLFNNIGILDFEVLGDRINPVLDVTFDGVRIMDGDIVSPVPLISIRLKDENEFLFVNDISNFEISIQKLPEPQASPVDLNKSEITFFPADSTNDNTARIEYDAEFESGDYILFVQARDASGNLSGDQELEIRFRVVEESQVSNVLNYPNPFSTSTEFVFTLTGYKVPEVFNIQIMTLSGKIVREITKEELGPLRIGLNRSSYKWNGTDQYGNRLANGVYLYRVMTSSNGETFDHFNNSSIDSYFKHGFGKLVIMR